MTPATEVTSTDARLTRFKPREKADTFGVTNLTTTELLALIIGSGTTKQSVFTLAKNLTPMIESGEFTKHPTQFKSLGRALFWRLQAVCELAQRLTSFVPTIRHPTDIWHACSYLAKKQQEYVIALYLDGRQKLIEKRVLAIGGSNFALLEPSTLLHPALLLPATSCILVHNHPSGNADPSQDDILVTQKLAAACSLVGIELLDHIVIGKDTYCSLKELGYLGSQ
jgi:DNA repair protein RadC